MVPRQASRIREHLRAAVAVALDRGARPWRSTVAAEVWKAELTVEMALDTASAWRVSAHDTEPSLTSASISLTAVSARRAASISMRILSHTSVISVKHLQSVL